MTEQLTPPAETFAERCRRLLSEQPDRVEFTISRKGLDTLVLDSERYAAANGAANELLLTARDIASMTTMMTRDSDAWLGGEWDEHLPRIMQEIARGSTATINHDCSKARRP